MSANFDQVYQHLKPSDLDQLGSDFENCEFQNCDFSNADLTSIKFTDCSFFESNLSLAKVRGVAFRSVLFKDCKMLGIHFDEVNPLSLELGFENCLLNHSSFYQLNLKKALFISSQLNECDFTECDLSQTNFAGSELVDAKFDRTNLENANLVGAIGFVISPVRNKVKGIKVSETSLIGLLTEFGVKVQH